MPGHLAQLGEHLLDVEGVRGSSPLVSTIEYQIALMSDFLYLSISEDCCDGLLYNELEENNHENDHNI